MFRRVNGKRSAGADLLIIRQNEAWCDNGLCAVNTGFFLAGEDADRAADERFEFALAGIDDDGGDEGDHFLNIIAEGLRIREAAGEEIASAVPLRTVAISPIVFATL